MDNNNIDKQKLKQCHTSAAEHLKKAAEHHIEAAKHHESGNLDKGNSHAYFAQGHSQQANKHAYEAAMHTLGGDSQKR